MRFVARLVRFVNNVWGVKVDSARLLHVVDVASVEILFVQPEENVEVRRHRAHFRVQVPFNPCLLELALRLPLIKLQSIFEGGQTMVFVVV